MSNIIPFDFNSHPLRVINDDNGEPWFVLADVCKALEISNTTHVSNRLDEDERSTFNVGRQGNATIINESGLYSVVLRSDKPAAKSFKKWITSEVLPSIRKKGSYQSPIQQSSNDSGIFDLAVKILNPDSSSKLSMLKRFGEDRGHDMAFLPSYVQSEGAHHSLSELLKKHGCSISARKANSILINKGLLEVKTRDSKTKGTKSFKAVSEVGLKYGCNLVNPNSQNETQAHWYDNAFEELLSLIEPQPELTA